MKKKNKRGFTLVELLVVIAILAILATVTVVGYIAFTDKAKLSNDQTTIKMINDNLQADEVLDGKPSSASEALTRLYGLGYNADKFETYSTGYHYAYNLENNKFYLVDDNDSIIFPESVEKGELWGLYKNRSTDKIQGVSNYIAMEAVTDSSKFNEAFGSGTYNLDLNNYYLNIKSDNASSITLSNGSVASDAGFGEGSNLVKRDLASKDTVASKDEDGNTLIQNLIFDLNNENVSSIFASLSDNSNGTVIIRNNTFIGQNDTKTPIYITSSGFKDNVQDIVIEGCTFTGFGDGAWSLTISPEFNITIKNNLFIQVGRGINIDAANSKNLVTNLKNIEISDNEFYLSNTSKSNALQISNFYDPQLNNIIGPIITYKDNYIEDANAVIVLHATMYNEDEAGVVAEYKDEIPLDLDNVKKLITFSNNKVDEGIQIAIHDPDLNVNVDKAQEAVDYIKSIFN